MRRSIMFTASLFLLSGTQCSAVQSASEVSVIPDPRLVEPREGVFVIDARLKVEVARGSDDLLELGRQLGDRLHAVTGFPVPVVRASASDQPSNAIVLALDPSKVRLRDEGYELDVTQGGIVISAVDPAGVFYGVQTLYQLLPPEVVKHEASPRITWSVPCVRIEDWPRFGWRGMHLDVGRHFFPKEFIERYLDLMAMYKFNRFHWHLTEDQGWRIEIKRSPRLTTVGSRRAPTADDSTGISGFYTQEDVREIVAYAQQRFITVVPEIEMPGHSLAALASYPEISCTGGPFEVGTHWGVFDDVCCPGNEKTFSFLEGVLDEVMAMFPGPYLHIGGDECPTVRWKTCPRCQARIRAEGLKGVEELESYFIKRIERYVNAKGKRIIGWDEILEGGLAPNATVMSWRGIAGGIAAARAGHDVVMTPTSNCYFDYRQAEYGEAGAGDILLIDSVYAYEPVPPDLSPEEAGHILGAQGNVWTEYMSDSSRVEYMVLPRMCALSEVVWSQPSHRNFRDFTRRLEAHYDRFAAMGVNFRVPPPEPSGGDAIISGDTTVAFVSPVATAEIRYTLDGVEPDLHSPVYTRPITINSSTTICARTFLRNGRTSNAATIVLSKVNPLLNGVHYRYFEGVWDSIPDFSALTPVRTGIVFDISLNGVEHRKEYYGMQFAGVLHIATQGDYSFSTVSDDGSRLIVDGKVVVNNDGLHGAQEVDGSIALAPGNHEIVVEFFQKEGGEFLEVMYEPQGKVRQHLPPHILFR